VPRGAPAPLTGPQIAAGALLVGAVGIALVTVPMVAAELHTTGTEYPAAAVEALLRLAVEMAAVWIGSATLMVVLAVAALRDRLWGWVGSAAAGWVLVAVGAVVAVVPSTDEMGWCERLVEVALTTIWVVLAGILTREAIRQLRARRPS
jgi:hypothetical protein